MTFKERVEIGDHVLYLGDAREILPTLQADAVVTDPPYGLDFKGESWDAAIPDWLHAARSAAPLVVFKTAPTTLWDYPRPDWIMSWFREGAQSRTKHGTFNHWTPILVYGKGTWNPDTYKTAAAVDGNANLGIDHPCPTPIRVMSWLVEGATRQDGVVLDPFMGSCSTGVACAKLGRKFIGVEIHKPYFRIACRRIADAVNGGQQPELFQ